MKLLLATSSFKTGLGGVASYAHDLVNALGTYYEITIITGDNIQTTNKCKDIYCYRFNDLSKKNAQNLYSLIKHLDPDIIINSNVPILAMIIPYLNDKIKIISISHFVNGPLSWSSGINAEFADAIISLSTFGKNYLEKKFNIDKNKIRIILNYVENKYKVEDNKENRTILNIVYPGGCSYKKSAEIVCHAILKLLQTDLEFNLYWLGGTKIAGARIPFIQLKDISNILPKNDNRIKHVGPVERSIAKKIIGNANIFLLPSRGEGFPISLVEAMSKSCIPIISDAKHGSLDIIKNGVNGIIIKQGKTKSLYKAIVDIIENHNKYISIYEKSLTTYEKLLSKEVWEKQMSETLKTNNNHVKRLQNFITRKYYLDRLIYKTHIFLYFLKDRGEQFYHYIYFKLLYIKYHKLP